MNLNRSQLSFLITFFSMSLMVLSLYNIHLGTKEKEDEYVIELLSDEELEKIIELEEKLSKELAQADPIKSHIAFNETAKPNYGDPEPLKTLEELLEEKAASEEAGEPNDFLDSEYAARVKELAEKREEKKQLLGEREEKKQEFTNNLAEKRTSITYSLIERNAYVLPPPIYTCIEGGKVVINIQVNSFGQVTAAKFNEKSSGTSNGCLVENAISYALRAKFNSSDKTTQKGTITYLFQSK
ncbi:MAG: hypothetical protein COA50_09685 [Flavobacteriaceae bacterium]|nr:MAG: hypothetical protein COA50_09685 [Flavobacteriaceae bacterium]